MKGYSLKNLVLYFLRLGTTGFGGPIALVGYMERDLVGKRGWLSQEEYLRGLALSEMMPGPLAAQLAIYIGYIKGKFLGATLVGIVFVLPSFIIVLLLGALYKSYGGLPWMQAVFYGIGAAVIAIIALSVYKLARLICKDKKLLWLLASIMFSVTVYTNREIIWILLVAGLIALVFYAGPKFLNRAQNYLALASLALPAIGQSEHLKTLANIFWFFLKASVIVFGSGLAVVPFLHSGVVEQFHWLNEKQFLDAVAVAMITPGPVVITSGFIGYLVAGIAGATLATLAIFLPVWFFVVIPTPYYERFANNAQLKAFISGITAATVGAIGGAVVILGKGTIVDMPTALIGLITLGLLAAFKIPEPLIILAAGLIGLVLKLKL